MTSSDSDSDSDWNREFLSAISKKRGKGAEICEQYRCEQMQECLDRGADINTVGKNGNTALHMAVKKGYREIVEFLKKKRARIDIYNKQDYTAITLAESLNSKDILSILKEPFQQRNEEATHRSRPATEFTSIDDEKPSTSRGCTLSSRYYSPKKMSDNQGNKLGPITKRKLDVNDKYDRNAKIPRLTLNDTPQFGRHTDGTVNLGTGGPSLNGDSDLGTNTERIIRTSAFDGKETYAASGLKRSLHGIVYQWKHLMLILNRAWKMGYSFRLATEMDAAEKFDDVVLEYEVSPGNKVHRFVQLKHKQDDTDCKMVSANHLLDVKDGEFSMQKYFISWRKIMKNSDFSGSKSKKFILCTNIGLDVEGLKKKNIDVSEIPESDDFFNVTVKTKRPPRFYKLVDKPSELCDTLKLASDVHLLARELAERVCGSKDIQLNSDIIKCYHAALAEEVIDVRNQKFSRNFINNNNLSTRATNFRGIFLFHMKKLSRRNLSEKDIWKNLEAKELKLSTNFGTKFELGIPQLTHVGRFSDEFVKLVNNASNDKMIKIDRRIYSKRASDLSVERIVADNIDKLAGHVLIMENRKIRFRSQFLNDVTQLLGNIREFKAALKTRLGSKFDKLDEFEFEINNFRSCTEEELYSRTELPVDDIQNEEISDFLNGFVLAVNQPNEEELGEMLTREIGDDSPFDLLDADLVRDSFQNTILDWLKGKEGKFLKNEDAQDFFNQIDAKLASLITMALSLEYSEKLEELGIKFNCKNTELHNFLNCPADTSNRILELISNKRTLLTALRVHQILMQSQKYRENESFIFIRLETLLRRKITKQVLRAFEWPRHHNLLVIDCESISATQYLEKLWNPLCETMAKNDHKRMIIITQMGEDIGTQFKLGHQTYQEKNYDHSFRNLTYASRKMLLGKPVTKFQGYTNETNFGELLGIRDSCNVMADELEDLSEIIDSDTLVQLICSHEIQIGGDLEDMGEIRDYYMNRTICRHVVIKEDVLKDQQIPDLLAISDIVRELPGKLMRTEEISSTPRNLMSDMVRISEIDRYLRGKLMNMGETSVVHRNLTNFTILHSTQEEEQFRTLCTNNEQRNIHWLKEELDNYIWKQSHGDITYLVQYRDVREGIDNHEKTGATYLNESQLVVCNEPVIISDTAGMGKTTMLTHLAREIKKNEPDSLVLKLDLNYHAASLEKVMQKSNYNLGINNEAVEFLVRELLLRDETNLARKVFKRIIEKRGKVALIFDGFDEISPTYEDTVINLLQAIANFGIKKLFVATRPHTRQVLESKLNVFSCEIQPLSADNQKDFLIKYWKTNLISDRDSAQKAEDRIKTYAEAIIQKLADSIKDQENQFTGIPLQARLVAEIFANHSEGKQENFDSCREFVDSDVDLPKFPEKMNLIHLYEHFVEKKFDIFFNKTGGNLANEAVKEFRKLRYDKFVDTHEKLAIDALFTEDQVRQLLPTRRNVGHKLPEKIRHAIVEERTGIITQFIDGKPHFGHRTYAEYFAAKLLSDMLKTGHQNKSSRKIFTADILLGENYENIRAFINLLLSDEDDNALEGESWKFHLNENRSKRNETIFHVAAAEGNPHIIRLFLNCLGTNPQSRKALVNVEDNSGRTALHRAVEYGNLNGIKLLVEHTECEINSRNMVGRTPLYAAAAKGELEVVKYLLDNGANASSQDHEGWTPLHLAAREGKLGVVECLADKGANINSRTNQGWTLLHAAAQQGKLEVVKYLADKGANVNSQMDEGWTPLHLAAQKGNLGVVKHLVDKGATVNSQMNDSWTPLHVAARDGKLEVVEYLVNKGADLNSQMNEGWTPLHLAAPGGKLELVGYLTDKGANVNSQTIEGWTPLHAAAQEGKLEIVKYLVNKEANVNSQTNDSRTPLHVAAREGKLEVVKYLANQGANVTSQTKQGLTPLHAAARKGNSEVVKYLVNKGVNVNCRTNEGHTPLHVAAQQGKLEVVEYLVNKGADVNSQTNEGRTPLHTAVREGELETVKYLANKGADINSQTNEGWTSLHVAAQQDKLELVVYLVDKGADVNSRMTEGWTPLHVAAEKGKLEVVEYLADKGANLDPQTNDGWMPLHMAVGESKLEVVEYLANKGVDVNSQTNDGWTPLHVAAREGKLEVVQYLTDKGANVNFQTNDSWTPLHIAAGEGKLEVVKYLADKEANVNSQSNDSWTPLHVASQGGQLEIVKCLAEKGANVNSHMNEGWTPLHLAAQAGELEIVEYLIDKGANINAPTNDGRTPLRMAAQKDKLEIVEYLTDKGANVNFQQSSD